MPLQNRVTPQGEIIISEARGRFMGNRGGRLHRQDRTLGPRRWASRQWITCVLKFNDRQRRIMSPNSYTELFFLDEATALAAGHRPCFECRRKAAVDFAAKWAWLRDRTKPAKAGDMDAALHAERLTEDGGKRTYRATLNSLPDGAMALWSGAPHLILGGELRRWLAAGYESAVTVDGATILDVLTPPSTVAVIAAGYIPDIHGSAATRR